MINVLDYAPVAATGFAVPQFLPQILKLRATGDTAGVSSAWAILTCLNNAAWLTYFTLEHYWTALIPSVSATTLAGTLAILLAMRDRPKPRAAIPIAAWAAMLIAAGLTLRRTGVSAGTWLLILGELTCWLTFGLHKSDPRLITLGLTGVTAGALMLARIHRAARHQQTAAA